MKRIILIAVVAFLAACSSNKFSINGVIENVHEGKVYLQRQVEKREYKSIDSAKIDINGEFKLSGSVSAPEVLYLEYQGKRTEIFVENSKIKFVAKDAKFEKVSVTGSASHDLYNKYLTIQDSIDKSNESFYEKYEAYSNKNVKDSIAFFEKKSKEIDSAKNNFTINFIKSNHSSTVAAYVIVKNLSNLVRSEYTELASYINLLDSTALKSNYGVQILENLNNLKKVSIGSDALDFTLKTQDGKDFTFSSVKGKTIVLVFWASWCPYCRIENKYYIDLYKQYKDVQFVFVSLDKEKDKWLKGIEEDKLNGIQVSELTKWKSSVAKLYVVKSIPSLFVIDKNFKIISKNTFGKDLSAKLKELTTTKK